MAIVIALLKTGLKEHGVRRGSSFHVFTHSSIHEILVDVYYVPRAMLGARAYCGTLNSTLMV